MRAPRGGGAPGEGEELQARRSSGGRRICWRAEVRAEAETRASARERGSRFPNRSASVAFPIAVAERKSNANAAFAMETVASRLAGLSCFSRRERAMSGTKQGPNHTLELNAAILILTTCCHRAVQPITLITKKMSR